MVFDCDSSRAIVYPGKGPPPQFRDGTKVKFHFKTIRKRVIDCGDATDEPETIDDSKKKGYKPMELILGKQFKLQFWEDLIKSMRLEEVSRITVAGYLCINYPLVSKAWRAYCGIQPEHETNHSSSRCCAGLMGSQSLGYHDLDQLQKQLTESSNFKLEFTFELLSVEQPQDYKKELWQMSDSELKNETDLLRVEGNRIYATGNHQEAAVKYHQALGILDNLLLKEKPHDEEWNKLDSLKIPLLLNLSQCKFLSRDYYETIEHTSQVIERESSNVKAIFRRGRAHGFVWNMKEAREDLTRALQLDPSLAASVQREMQLLERREAEQREDEKKRLSGKLFS